MDAPTIESPPPEPTEPVPGPPGPSAAAPRRLTRSPDQRLLGGVAGGLAEYLGVDPVIVRLGFVVTAFFGGLGVIAYVIGWIALPVGAATTRGGARSAPDRKQLIGYGLVALGLVAVGGRIGWSVRGDGIFWPLVLIGLGAAVLVLRRPRRGTGPARPPDGSPAGPGAPGRAHRADDRDRPRRRSRHRTDDQPGARPRGAARTTEVVPRQRSPGARCSVLVGGAWLLDAAGVVDVNVGVVVALGLVVVGAALVISVWLGRSRGLIAVGIPLALVVGALGVVDVPLDGGIGNPNYRPPTLARVECSYALGIGDLSLDLRAADFSGTRRHVHAQLGIGQLNVTVPDDVRVVLDGHVGAGSVSAFGRQSNECCPTDVHMVRPGVAGGGTLVLDADVGAGNIRIKREENLRGTS